MAKTQWPAPSGYQYAIRILIGTAISWSVLASIHADPLWAIISVVVVSEAQIETAIVAFESRVANTVIGCAVGVLFLYLFGPVVWSVPLAMALAVIICTNLIRVPLTWRIAPITVALIMTPGALSHQRSLAMSIAWRRTAGVIFGSAVAVGVSYAASKFQTSRGTGVETIGKNERRDHSPDAT